MYLSDIMLTRSATAQTEPRTFVEQLKHRTRGIFCTVRTYDDQKRQCWFLLKTTERQIIKLKCTLHDEMIDLNAYGEVVDSGWGKPEQRTFFI